jgi:ABC-type multidrug transport system fused ATPase/permease subunit
MVNSGFGWAQSRCGRVLLLLKQRRATTVFLLGLILVTSSLEITVPFLTQHLVDGVVQTVRSAHSLTIFGLLVSLAAIFLSVAATRVLRSVYNYRLFRTVTSLEDEIKTAAFENYLRLDMAYHTKANSGQVIGTLDRGATAIFIVLYEILGQNLLPPLIIFVGVFASLLLKNPWIALAVFVPLPVYLLIVGRFSAPMHELEQVVNRGFEAVSKECYDIAGNLATVKKFCQEGSESAMQRRLLAKARAPQFRAERNWAVIENIQTIIATLGRVTVIGLGAFFVLTKRCSIGEYVLFIAMQDMLFGPMSQLSILLPKLRRNLARAEGLFEILDQKPDLIQPQSSAVLPPLAKQVEFRNVSFRYPGSHSWTLRDVNFTIPAGSTVALIGRSGSGKTTLINLLLRCYDPQQGSILIDGNDVRHTTQESLRRHIAVVPQEVDLFSRTVEANIAYGSPEASSEDVEEAARLALAHGFIERSENGYSTIVGERGLKLSGGERQRIGIARAILRDPRILILDEATSHLDTESEHLIQTAMQRIAEGRTSLIIAHRLSTVMHADFVVVFGNGGVEAVGTHAELWHTSPTYRRLHEIHARANKPLIEDSDFDAEAALPMAC